VNSHLVLNEELPLGLRRRLVRDARERDVRINDVAGEILAAHYGAKWVPSGLTYRKSTARTDKIRVPEALHKKIRLGALRASKTMRGVVLEILAAHYGFEVTFPTTRKPRKGN